MDTTAEAETPLVDADDDIRRRLALVLDVDDLVAARRMAQTLRPWFGVVKVLVTIPKLASSPFSAARLSIIALAMPLNSAWLTNHSRASGSLLAS